MKMIGWIVAGSVAIVSIIAIVLILKRKPIIEDIKKEFEKITPS